ncbi:MAG: substrate-binding domain-containing protein [Victivallales bacterium]
MNNEIPSISFLHRQAAHRQIADALREKINSGEILPGTHLPSTQVLAKSWNTHVATVHMALAMLAKEGLLDRLHRKGTFVRQTGNRLSTIGVYSSNDLWTTDNREADYCRHLYRSFKEILNENKISERFFLDIRTIGEQTLPWPPLEKAVNGREIQGLLVLTMYQQHIKWIPRQVVPMTGLSTSLPYHVANNMKQFFEAGVRSLIEKGCRSIGLITPLSKDHNLYEEFLCAIRKAGLETRNEWIRASSEHIRDHEQYGYEQFRSLWKQALRPDGVLVFPDNVAKGVVTAVLREKIRIPEDIRLVLHRNKELEYLCPFPVTFLESSCRATAGKLWGQLQHQLQGELPGPMILDYAQIENTGYPD